MTLVSLAERRPAWLEAMGNPTGSGVSIGMIDSGWTRVVTDHRISVGVSMSSRRAGFRVDVSGDYNDETGHGTACADIVWRVAPAATVVPIRVFANRLETSVEAVVAALDWAVDHGLRLVNVSLGTVRPEAYRPLYLACARAHERGAVIVAGQREGAGMASAPSAFGNVIGVTGHAARHIWDIRYRAGASAEVHAMLRHSDVLWRNGVRRAVAGTSFAAPVVTGLAALWLERHAEDDIEGVRSFLESVATQAEPYSTGMSESSTEASKSG